MQCPPCRLPLPLAAAAIILGRLLMRSAGCPGKGRPAAAAAAVVPAAAADATAARAAQQAPTSSLAPRLAINCFRSPTLMWSKSGASAAAAGTAPAGAPGAAGPAAAPDGGTPCAAGGGMPAAPGGDTGTPCATPYAGWPGGGAPAGAYPPGYACRRWEGGREARMSGSAASLAGHGLCWCGCIGCMHASARDVRPRRQGWQRADLVVLRRRILIVRWLGLHADGLARESQYTQSTPGALRATSCTTRHSHVGCMQPCPPSSHMLRSHQICPPPTCGRSARPMVCANSDVRSERSLPMLDTV